MTREQRDFLRNEIDARMRQRLRATAPMAPKGARPTGHVPKAQRPVSRDAARRVSQIRKP